MASYYSHLQLVLCALLLLLLSEVTRADNLQLSNKPLTGAAELKNLQSGGGQQQQKKLDPKTVHFKEGNSGGGLRKKIELGPNGTIQKKRVGRGQERSPVNQNANHGENGKPNEPQQQMMANNQQQQTSNNNSGNMLKKTLKRGGNFDDLAMLKQGRKNKRHQQSLKQKQQQMASNGK